MCREFDPWYYILFRGIKEKKRKKGGKRKKRKKREKREKN
jgi:hypothetical protein